MSDSLLYHIHQNLRNDVIDIGLFFFNIGMKFCVDRLKIQVRKTELGEYLISSATNEIPPLRSALTAFVWS